MTLRLGPLLRKTTATTAAVWVETDAAGTVTVSHAESGTQLAAAGTVAVHGHHYALCELTGLAPDSATPYTVEVDGARVWPLPGTPHPPSVIHTLGPGPLRLAFGSCRTPTDHSPGAAAAYGPDALRAYALRLAGQRAAGGGEGAEPHALLLIGDQVYADELQPPMKDFLRTARAAAPERASARPPEDEVVFFDEYAELYRQAWTDPDVRWLLSTVPSLMLFDDHDVRDDWNTSGAWRGDMAAEPWWQRRITSALGAYWVYQHLGNLTGGERAADPLFAEVAAAAAEGRDAGGLVDAMAGRAHQDPQSRLWSHAHDLPGARLLMVDARASRDVADDTDRSITGRRGADWLAERLRGGTEHLLVASTLPFLLPRGVHHLEGWDEAVCAGTWGQRARPAGEKLRRAVDLEHWSAFRASQDAVAHAVLATARGERGAAPSTVLFLSGDVHFHYLARAEPADGAALRPHSTIAQITASPLCNRLRGPLRWAARLSGGALARLPTSILARLARVAPSPLAWGLDHGPWFDNGLATLTLDGPRADVAWAFAADNDGARAVLPADSPAIALTPQPGAAGE